jgi:hypothetical protein
MMPEELYVFTTIVIAALLALLMLTSAYKRRLDFKLRKAEIEALRDRQDRKEVQ